MSVQMLVSAERHQGGAGCTNGGNSLWLGHERADVMPSPFNTDTRVPLAFPLMPRYAAHARDAADAVVVDYEPLPSIVSVRES